VVRPELLQELPDYRDVSRSDGVLAHLARLVEGEVEEPGVVLGEAEYADPGHGLGLADHPLDVQDLGDVHLARLLAGKERGDAVGELRDLVARDTQVARRA